MVDLNKIKPYAATSQWHREAGSSDPAGDYTTVLRDAGFIVNTNIAIGKIQRFAEVDKPKNFSGWSLAHEIVDGESNRILVCSYGSWRNFEVRKWYSRSPESMSPIQRDEYHAKIAVMQKEQEAEKEKQWSEAAEKAQTLISTMAPCINHDYLIRKRVKPYGVFVNDEGQCVIPIYINGKIASTQRIWPNGARKFMYNGKFDGGYFKISGKESTVIIAEGYATAASIHEATGFTVYVAFTAHNMYEVAVFVKKQHPSSKLIIAGDDDAFSKKNVGRERATLVAEGLGVTAVFPIFAQPNEGKTDFNDLHVAEGLKRVAEFFGSVNNAYVKPEPPIGQGSASEPPMGFLRDVYDYYNATAGNPQFGFSAQTALALGSVLLARNFRSDKGNFSSLFFLNVGLSSSGKEHAKTTIEKILTDSGMEHLISGDGYTSSGAVFSALLDKPRHISVIDEFGRYLESCINEKGNGNQRTANTKLMEAITKTHSTIRPPMYSTMSLKKDVADSIKDRKVCNPGITLLTMTTPDTLFNVLGLDAIKDGFINRFIISISDAKRAIRKHKPEIKVPDSIVGWIKAINSRVKINYTAQETPVFNELFFEDAALAEQEIFQQYCIDRANELDRFGMAELTGRANEIAMRMSLIAALSRDPYAESITLDDIKWSIAYVKECLDKTIAKLKLTVSASDFESHKKEVLAAIREASPDGVRFSTMNKAQPYTKHQRKYLQEILDALVDADLIDWQQADMGSAGGRPTKLYFALK